VLFEAQYALASVGNEERARAHWWLAWQSDNHPDASTWASAAMRRERSQAVATGDGVSAAAAAPATAKGAAK